MFPFCRAIVAGVSNSVSKIIGSVGNGMSELTFDKEFNNNRIRNRNIKIDGLKMGVNIGLK